eukprot:GHVU01171508.1.p1 GENE.GHVU01171508.1~~GHVU01171508.1.p1  ORF type:complete len:482 (+),score=104.93 GHVU01171508.1:1695-3140(+)
MIGPSLLIRFCYACTAIVLVLAVAEDPKNAVGPQIGNNTQRYSFEMLRSMAEAMHSKLVSTRRDLHKVPELLYEEEKTGELVKKYMHQLGIDLRDGWGRLHERNQNKQLAHTSGGYGVIADIGSKSGPLIIHRADMDGLPIEEAAEVYFKSKNPGRMHACGHDAHMTMLLGAAEILHSINKVTPLYGTVRMMFQPAEEGGAGAKQMIIEGVLKDKQRQAVRAFGMHVWPYLPTGTIGGRPGTIMAATTGFSITVVGKGGHAAMPLTGIDPFPAVAAIIQGLHALASREFYFTERDAGLITVTAVHGGTAHNVIPGEVEMKGTLRALSMPKLMEIRQRIDDVVKRTARAYRCTAKLFFEETPYPPTFNHPDVYNFVKKTITGAIGEEHMVTVNPNMGGEDFAYVADQVPATFLYLGSGSGDEIDGHPATNTPLHRDSFTLDERVLPLGAALHAYIALETLEDLRRQAEAHEDSIKRARAAEL